MLNLLYLLAALVYLPFLLYQMIFLGKNRRGWRERFGRIPVRGDGRGCVWIHAVSLGEVNATRRLVEEIETHLPEYEVVISSTTDTGIGAARRLYPGRLIFRYPLDLSFFVRRALGRIRPNAVVLMELEAWPNFIRLAAQRGILVGIANGRVTEEKSMRRFGLPLVRGISRDMFARLWFVGAQNEAYARRFEALGVRREAVCVTGSLKYDTAIVSDRVSGDRELAEAMGIDRSAPLIVAGSTGPGEEALVLDAFEALCREIPAVQLAIVPRKPERFDEVGRLIERRGYSCVRRSKRPDGDGDRGAARAGGAARVFLGDTMGELRKFYALADAVFVGRTLVPLGGSDLMEVAALARPMCFGPFVENFADIADQLLRVDAAVRVESADGLVGVLRKLLSNREHAAALGGRAQEVVKRNVGASRRTVELLKAALK